MNGADLSIYFRGFFLLFFSVFLVNNLFIYSQHNVRLAFSNKSHDRSIFKNTHTHTKTVSLFLHAIFLHSFTQQKNSWINVLLVKWSPSNGHLNHNINGFDSNKTDFMTFTTHTKATKKKLQTKNNNPSLFFHRLNLTWTI